MEVLAADQLIAAARQRTGLERFDSDSFREGLDRYLADINKVERSAAAFTKVRETTIKFLALRLKVTDYTARRPEILDAPVERPVFVMGIPRTGTTLTSNLLAADPGRRSLLDWEADEAVPPPRAGELFTDPRATERLRAEARMLADNPAAGRFYRASAIYPTEDIFPMSHDFRTQFLGSHGPLPEFTEWLLQCDMTSAYEYLRKFLQVLQSDAPGIWNLKMPSHAMYVPFLLKVFPDARLVWTHRDPITATSSFCSLVAQSHRAYLGHADSAWIGRTYPGQAAEHVNRLMATREVIGRDRIYDLHYADMLRDPLAAMRKLYAWLGDEFSAAAEAGMSEWLAANPQGKFGKHEYRLAEYGLDKDGVAANFAPYLAQYAVEPEG